MRTRRRYIDNAALRANSNTEQLRISHRNDKQSSCRSNQAPVLATHHAETVVIQRIINYHNIQKRQKENDTAMAAQLFLLEWCEPICRHG